VLNDCGVSRGRRAGVEVRVREEEKHRGAAAVPTRVRGARGAHAGHTGEQCRHHCRLVRLLLSYTYILFTRKVK
jgi:hypothetical protein